MNYNEFEIVSLPMTRLYNALELELMKSIARRFLLHREVTGTIEWEMRMLAEAGSLTRENIEIMTSILSGGDETLEEMIHTIGMQSIEEMERILIKARDKPVVPVTQSARLQSVYKYYHQQAADKLNQTNTTMLSMAEQSYRNMVSKAALKIATGQTTRTKALEECIEEFAQEGIPALIDKAGRKWSPEAYVNMVIRTTSNNVYREATFARLDDWNEDLFVVSWHQGARPLCEPYQNKILSRSGRDGTTYDMNNTPIHYIPLSSTSYGEPAGLFGINCGHFPILFLEGVSFLPKGPTESQKKENEKEYKESQMQRALERKIRKLRLEKEVAESSGEEELVSKISKKLRTATQSMRLFIEHTGRTRRPDREKVYSLARRGVKSGS